MLSGKKANASLVTDQEEIRGKWYFMYTHYTQHTLRDEMGGMKTEIKLPLKASTEKEAISEAKRVWSEVDKNKHYDPFVAYMIPLEW